MNTAMTTLGGMSDDTITFTGSVFSEDTLIAYSLVGRHNW